MPKTRQGARAGPVGPLRSDRTPALACPVPRGTFAPMSTTLKPSKPSPGTGAGTPTIWLDGEWFDRETATVSVYDHGLLYGDGVFEGIRVYNGKVFRLREHVDRLYESARHIALEIPL